MKRRRSPRYRTGTNRTNINLALKLIRPLAKKRPLLAILVGAVVLLGIWLVPSHPIINSGTAEWTDSGHVIRVSDGDTLTVHTAEGTRITVRLSGIDAPETGHGTARPGQPFGPQSRQSLHDFAYGQQVELECFETDRYQRSVCRVWVNGLDINAEQVQRGMAWVYRVNRSYVHDSRLYALEDRARAASAGLWRASHPVAPWDWRKECWQHQRCQ